MLYLSLCSLCSFRKFVRDQIAFLPSESFDIMQFNVKRQSKFLKDSVKKKLSIYKIAMMPVRTGLVANVLGDIIGN